MKNCNGFKNMTNYKMVMDVVFDELTIVDGVDFKTLDAKMFKHHITIWVNDCVFHLDGKDGVFFVETSDNAMNITDCKIMYALNDNYKAIWAAATMNF